MKDHPIVIAVLCLFFGAIVSFGLWGAHNAGVSAGSQQVVISTDAVQWYPSANTQSILQMKGFDASGIAYLLASSAGTQMLYIANENSSGSLAVGIASSTFSSKVLGLGTAGSTNGTSTIAAGKIQIDGYNSAGTRVCFFIVGTTATTTTGACNQ